LLPALYPPITATMSVTTQVAIQYEQGQIGHLVSSSDDEVIIINPPFIVNVFDPGPGA